jgi:hypothetical protein
MDIWRPILVGRKDVPIKYYRGKGPKKQEAKQKNMPLIQANFEN